MRLIHQGTASQNYTTTLSSLYQNEILPYITYGDYSKLCVVLFEGNTTTLGNKIDCIFFSLGVAINDMTTNTKNGGMVRGGYANIRDLNLSNDARCSEGTIIKIYEIDI